MTQAPKKKTPKKGPLSLLSLRRQADIALSGLPDLMLEAEKAAASVLSGEHAQRKPGPGEKFWQYREYDPSDRPQDIDWRVSAKGDRIYVRQQEWQNTQTALFYVQNDRAMRYHSKKDLPEKLESAMILTLALSFMMTRSGELVGMLGGSRRPGRTETAIEIMGEEMLIRAAAPLPEDDLQALPKDAGMIIAGDFLCAPEQTKAFIKQASARTRNILLLQILDPAEMELPFSGRVIFENPEAQENHHLQNVESIRKAYQERMDSHLSALDDIARRYGIARVLHRTDQPVRDTLFKIWALTARQQNYAGGTGR